MKNNRNAGILNCIAAACWAFLLYVKLVEGDTVWAIFYGILLALSVVNAVTNFKHCKKSNK